MREKPAASIFKVHFYAADRSNKWCHILQTVTCSLNSQHTVCYRLFAWGIMVSFPARARDSLPAKTSWLALRLAHPPTEQILAPLTSGVKKVGYEGDHLHPSSTYECSCNLTVPHVWMACKLTILVPIIYINMVNYLLYGFIGNVRVGWTVCRQYLKYQWVVSIGYQSGALVQEWRHSAGTSNHWRLD